MRNLSKRNLLIILTSLGILIIAILRWLLFGSPGFNGVFLSLLITLFYASLICLFVIPFVIIYQSTKMLSRKEWSKGVKRIVLLIMVFLVLDYLVTSSLNTVGSSSLAGMMLSPIQTMRVMSQEYYDNSNSYGAELSISRESCADNTGLFSDSTISASIKMLDEYTKSTKDGLLITDYLCGVGTGGQSYVIIYEFEYDTDKKRDRGVEMITISIVKRLLSVFDSPQSLSTICIDNTSAKNSTTYWSNQDGYLMTAKKYEDGSVGCARVN